MTVAAQTKPLAEREVTIIRVFDAPRALVFKAWTDPQHLAQWWGPHRLHHPGLRVRCARRRRTANPHARARMATVYPMQGEIRELVAPERLVFTSVATDAAGKPLLEQLPRLRFSNRTARPQ